MSDKPKIAIYWCSSCGGCVVAVVAIVGWALHKKKHSNGFYDDDDKLV